MRRLSCPRHRLQLIALVKVVRQVVKHKLGLPARRSWRSISPSTCSTCSSTPSQLCGGCTATAFEGGTTEITIDIRRMDGGICGLSGRGKNIGLIQRSGDGLDPPRLQERNLLIAWTDYPVTAWPAAASF